MILVDTSAWLEYLRDTASTSCARVDELLAEEFAIRHPVRTEVLAGVRDEQHLRDLRGPLARGSIIETRPTDVEDAAALHRTCRRQGETVRKLIDCLIAAQAVRSHLPLLQADSDYAVLARHTGLVVEDG